MRHLICLLALLLCFGCVAPQPFDARLEQLTWGQSLTSLGVGRFTNEEGFFYGSGFAVTPDLIVTAHHVAVAISGPILFEGRPAEIVRLHRGTDLAVIRSVGHGLQPLEFREPVLGEPAITAGYVGVHVFWHEGRPYGGATVTRGHVSSLDFGNWVGFNGGVQPGMSGGPLLGLDGRVLGIAAHCPPWSDWGPGQFSVNPTMAHNSPGTWARDLVAEVRPDDPALQPPPRITPMLILP